MGNGSEVFQDGVPKLSWSNRENPRKPLALTEILSTFL